MTSFVTILGYGVTGQALARYCERQNLPYKILEDKNFSPPVNSLYKGAADPSFADHPCAVYLSPGLAPNHPWRVAARNKGIPELGEFALAAKHLRGKIIGVTGTNGKSTVVTLIHALLKNAGVDAGLFGNIGTPLIDATGQNEHDYYVVEESSFQLETMGNLKHHIAVCLNVTDDHYERYADIHEYARAKSLILSGMGADDFFIYNQDDPHCERMSRNTIAKKKPFSLTHDCIPGGSVERNQLVIKMNGDSFFFDTNTATLKGLHNQENMLAALSAVLSIKNDTASVASYRNTLATFRGLPHRVEFVAEKNGVRYYDDSKGTNVGAVVMALAGFDAPVILIAGGRDKGGDYTPLKGLVKGKVKHLILIGEARPIIHAALKGLCPITEVEKMAEAVKHAHQIGAKGDVVLLSPACSSFDQYKNYHERGLDFQNCVMSF